MSAFSDQQPKPTGLLNDSAPSVERKSGLLAAALVITIVFHGTLLFTGSFTETYDAFIHIFLGDHYARDWFSTWDQRWYTGFTTVSYPPAVHMVIAAVGSIFGDLRIGFILTMLLGMVLVILGVYRFSRLWVGPKQAGFAALVASLSSGLVETVHLYGQLPTIWALGFLLNASWHVGRYTKYGNFKDLWFAIALLAATTAGHHVTTLFGAIFFLGPVIVYALLNASRSQSPMKGSVLALTIRRISAMLPELNRAVVLTVSTVALLIFVVLPYWLWTARDPITQISIPHGSRQNFISNPNLGLIFFVIPWGLLIFCLPAVTRHYIRERQWPLAASLGLAFVLGTGGTTPIPSVLLGGAFDILTLDRFTLWATILILPGAGALLASAQAKLAAISKSRVRPLAMAGASTVILSFVAFAIFSASLTQYRPFQPDEIDTDPIVDFLERDQHDRWRYLTLGFGDQIAWLSTQTTATQVDGNYHSARRLPELVSTSVERLEGAKYRGVDGLGSLQQFLEVPERYNLKFVFSNDRFYDPVLNATGWINLGPLENGIDLWERADIEPLPTPLPVNEIPAWQRLLWGTVPPIATLIGLVSIGLGYFSSSSEPSTSSRKAKGRLQVGLAMWAEQRLESTHTQSEKSWSVNLAERINFKPLYITIGVIGFAGLAWSWASGSDPTPEEVIEEFYVALDERRFTDAYGLLDPDLRPSFELWQTQRSRDGGLIASFALLDEVESKTISQDDNSTELDVDLRYLTSLNFVNVEQTRTVNFSQGSWRIVPSEPDESTTPDQLLRSGQVSLFERGRRQTTDETTDLADVQDRPNLELADTALTVANGRPRLVGTVTNVDVDPADLTITGTLLEDGEATAIYNAAGSHSPTLLPGESTPFQVEFEEVAAQQAEEFDPIDWQPITVESLDGLSAQIDVRAVVATDRLERGLAASEVSILETDGQKSLSGLLRNTGANNARVPRVLVSYLNEDGTLLDQQQQFVTTSIGPSRSTNFEIELNPSLGGIAIDGISSSINGLEQPNTIPATVPALTLDVTGEAYDSIRIDVAAYWGEQ